jgi:hypothetical protein
LNQGFKGYSLGGAHLPVLLQGFVHTRSARAIGLTCRRGYRDCEELGVATGEGFDLFKGCAAIRPN